MTNRKKQNQGKGGISPVVAAVTGAVVGVTVAGALALKDQKNRDKVKKAFAEVKEHAADYMKNAKIKDKKKK